ncbi:hypothetical protein L9W92_09405 [Pelotomaculum terephthalicicum JT]|uniref:hypothetical protein n=1 Tax=Pelotomaculum TaxID=191373 RepID=UPI0009CBA45D|nr:MULTISPECIES: hypothetical protein [Pelotomaculum]MCG9968267.1 hypothetical protein [Pelotomaculum terephthalicicum JT]OPX87287.1 MAG: hypothetical protein A4E54_01745 [Pelotomaculum sp. PtaB.Bin117]OPY61345.1 MAG: hypothetical protein A4E56_02130 [Pelotomaculum sp. PtaU1.Bin065]
MMYEVLAHSTRDGKPPQSYAAHVTGVVARAQDNLEAMTPFIPEDCKEAFQSIVMKAADFHDLGKLDESNQAALHEDTVYKSLPVEHRDAGVKFLLEHESNWNSAVLVFAHHRPGLPNMMDEKIKRLPLDFLKPWSGQTSIWMIIFPSIKRRLKPPMPSKAVGWCWKERSRLQPKVIIKEHWNFTCVFFTKCSPC